MKSRNSWILLSLLISCGSLLGQERVLTKEEAIALALESNYGILMADNNVEIAENNQGILNSGFLPVVGGQAGAAYGQEDRIIDPEDGDRVEQEDAENNQYNASVSVDYLLFDGLGRWYNYKSLKEQYDLTQLEARETVENTLLQLFTVYFEIARLTENIDVLEETLEISRERLLRAGYQFDFGQSNNLAVLNAEVDVNNDSISLLTARQQLHNTKRDLNVLLGREVDNNEFTVDTTVNFTPMLQLEAFADNAEANNVLLLQSAQSLLISEYAIKVSRSGYLPSVGLSGSYGWNKNRSAATAFFPGSTTTSTGLSAGVSLSWDLFDGGTTRVQTQNARIRNRNEQLLREQIRLEVERDIENALGIYENRLFILQVQEQNVATNRDNFDRTQEQYRLGRVTSIEFRQAQINLLNALTNLNLAKYDAKLAELEVLRLTGELLNTEF